MSTEKEMSTKYDPRRSKKAATNGGLIRACSNQVVIRSPPIFNCYSAAERNW